MTPIWKAYAQYLARAYTPANMPDIDRRFLQAARAFDLSGVEGLCDQVWRELFHGESVHVGDGSELYDLGERCVVPCESMWLEFETTAFLVETCVGPGSGIYRIAELVIEGRRGWLESRGRAEQAGELFQVGVAEDAPDRPDVYLVGWRAVGMFLAALAVINSPRAHEATAKPKKLIGNKFPKGFNTGLQTTKILIDIGGGRSAGGGGLQSTSSPKAYHFVRSHARTLANGQVTTVRAHWRGDPAFGIRTGVYSIRDRRDTVH